MKARPGRWTREIVKNGMDRAKALRNPRTTTMIYRRGSDVTACCLVIPTGNKCSCGRRVIK